MLIQLLKGGYSGKEIVFYLLIMLLALTLSFSVHEFMHAFVAYKLGDSTAKNLGRVTLNPISHVDPMGVLLLLLAGFGWGKPVPYNPSHLTKLKNKTVMCIMVHLAGVTGNFLLALITRVLSTVFLISVGPVKVMDTPYLLAIYCILTYIDTFSISLLAFNLLPIPPLDGFHVVEELIPFKYRQSNGYRTFMRYGPQALLILVFLGSFAGINILSTVINFIALPFDIVINLVVGLVSFAL